MLTLAVVCRSPGLSNTLFGIRLCGPSGFLLSIVFSVAGQPGSGEIIMICQFIQHAMWKNDLSHHLNMVD